MKNQLPNIELLATAMQKIAQNYHFKLFSADLVDYFNGHTRRRCRPNAIIFSTPNLDQQPIIFLSYWNGTWHTLTNPQKYKVYFHVTQPSFTQHQAKQFVRELNRLTTPHTPPLTPHDFIAPEDWQCMPAN